MYKSKKILSFFLSLVILLSIVNPVLAKSVDIIGNDTKEVVELKKEVNESEKKQSFTLKSKKDDVFSAKTRNKRSLLNVFNFIGVTSFRNVNVVTTKEEKITVTLKTKGLSNTAFDWRVFDNNSFTANIIAIYDDNSEIKLSEITFNQDGDKDITVTTPVYQDKKLCSYNIITSFSENYEIRAFQSAGTGVGQPNGSYAINFDVMQIAKPILQVKYVDPYNNPLTNDNIPSEMPKIKLNSTNPEEYDDIEIEMPLKTSKINFRSGDDSKTYKFEPVDESMLNQSLNGVKYTINDKTEGNLVSNDKNYKYKITSNEKTGGLLTVTHIENIIVPQNGEDGKPLSTPEGYVRFTFDATADGTIVEKNVSSEDNGVRKLYFDVLNTLTYDQVKLNEILDAIKVVPKDKTKEFNAWDPEVSTKTEKVEETTFNATYKDKDKIKVIDNEGTEVEEGYVRLIFDSTNKGNIYYNNINSTKTKKIIDVLRNTPYADEKLKEEIAKITAVPTDTSQKFDSWNPLVPTENAFVKTGTFTAQYTSKDKVIVNPTGETPQGYVRVTFNSGEGTFGKVQGTEEPITTITYDVKDTLKWGEAKADGLVVPTPIYKDETKVFVNKWDKEIPADTAVIKDGEKEFIAKFITSGDEIGKDDKLPKGWFKVTVSRDEKSVKEDAKYGKTYAVKEEEKLSQDKFPTPTANKDYKEAKWNVETPWEQAIKGETEFKATATSSVFDESNIKSIEVTTMPTKKDYTDGDKFEVAGTTVTLTDANGNTKTVTSDKFAEECITVKPANGDKITLANNEKPIHVRKEFTQANGITGKVKADSTDKLKVGKAESTETIVPYEPADSSKPVDENDANLPKEDKDGNNDANAKLDGKNDANNNNGNNDVNGNNGNNATNNNNSNNTNANGTNSNSTKPIKSNMAKTAIGTATGSIVTSILAGLGIMVAKKKKEDEEE